MAKFRNVVRTEGIEKINEIPHFTEQDIETTMKEFMTVNNLSTGEIMPLFRVALAGGLQGPPVFAMMDVLGKEISVKRLKQAIEKFNNLQYI